MPTLLERAAARFTGGDPERLAQRRLIKAEIAKLETLKSRSAEIQNQQKRLNAREEEIVAEHERTCGPIQERLAETEVVIEKALLAGETPPAATTKKRADALQALADANYLLQAEVDIIKKQRAKVSNELAALQPQFSRLSELRGKLCAHGVADPQLLLERFANTERIRYAEVRIRSAEKSLRQEQESLEMQIRSREKYERMEELEPSDHEKNLMRAVEQWQYELEMAQAERTIACVERERIIESIIAE